MKKVVIFGVAILLILSLAACLVPKEPNPAEMPRTSPDYNKTDVISLSTYELDSTKTDQENLVSGNSAFALNLYQALIKDPENLEQNLFLSPYSISLALAMTYAGARNETEHQMAQTMNFILPQDRLHPAFHSLNTELNSRIQDAQSIVGNLFRLDIANAIWGQQGYSFLPEFIDLLTTNYKTGIRTVDFINAPENSRLTINNWISDQTEDRIKDVIPSAAIDSSVSSG